MTDLKSHIKCNACGITKVRFLDKCIQCGTKFVTESQPPENNKVVIELQRYISASFTITLPEHYGWDDVINTVYSPRHDRLTLTFTSGASENYGTQQEADAWSDDDDTRAVIYDEDFAEELWRDN